MLTTAFDRFKDSLERGITSREDLESLDLSALQECNDLDRERARQLLSAKVGDSDPRIIDALALIDTAKAWADIERAFLTGYGSALVRAAMHLWRKNQDPRVVPKLKAEALGNPDAPSYVIEVLLALAQIPGDQVDDILIEALTTTKEAQVAIVARQNLYARFNWSDWEQEGSPLFAVTCGMRSNFPSVRTKAFEQLHDLVRRRRAGESDQQLGIVAQYLDNRSPELQALLQLAFHPDSAPVPDVAVIDKLQGGERLWAIDLLIARLEQNDARVIPLLERLGGERIQLALDDHRAGRWIP
jgi:hypothetical protein